MLNNSKRTATAAQGVCDPYSKQYTSKLLSARTACKTTSLQTAAVHENEKPVIHRDDIQLKLV